MSDGAFKVTCTHCRRSYTWKKELAGKRGKCKCGQVLVMPLASPQAESGNDLDALAELAADAKTAAVDPRPIAFPVAAVAAEVAGPISAPSVRALDYRGSHGSGDSIRTSSKSLTDPIRDIYVPLGMFIAGFAAALIWVFTQPKTGTAVPVLTSFLEHFHFKCSV